MLETFKKKEYTVEVLLSTIEREDGVEVTEQDIQKVKDNDTETLYKIGEAYRKKKNYKKAFRWYYKAALLDHAGSQAEVGLMYRMGWGVPIDFKKAMDWSMKAATNGNAKGQFTVGVLYSNGYGVPLDYKQSMDWCLKAANNGSSDAMHYIGMMYHHGSGVAKNIPSVIEWYTKASNQGHAFAQSSLGLIYRYNDEFKDLQKSVNLYQKAHDNGERDAKYSVKELNDLGYYAEEDGKDKEFDQVVDTNKIQTHTIENIIQKMKKDLDNSQTKIIVNSDENCADPN